MVKHNKTVSWASTSRSLMEWVFLRILPNVFLEWTNYYNFVYHFFREIELSS